MGKERLRTFSGKINERACRGKNKTNKQTKKTVHKNETKISRFTFLTLDADIANDVYKGLIDVRYISLNTLKSTLASNKRSPPI